MTYEVTIDAPGMDDWETLWSGDWRVPPQIGMTFEFRRAPGGSVSWWRVVGVHMVMFEDEGFSTGCIVYARMIDPREVVPKP